MRFWNMFENLARAHTNNRKICRDAHGLGSSLVDAVQPANMWYLLTWILEHGAWESHMADAQLIV